MLAPLKWLNEYVDIVVEPQDFMHRMIMSGSEIEEMIVQRDNISGVISGKITQLDKHPNADKLQICQIDIGQDASIQVVTGARNVYVGMVVPVACHGAKLPGGEITRGKLRGEVSEGMLCSGKELDLTSADFPGADIDGIMPLPENTPLGRDIRKVIGQSDVIFDFKTLANRPDCMSIIGLAREAAATLGETLRQPKIAVPECEGNLSDTLDVRVAAEDLCPRFMARYVKNVRLAPSPQWLRERLIAAGMRPINNVVDVTNYVMLEMGQPLHAYDLRDIEGSTIIVRRAYPNEKITTLDEKEHLLSPDVLVIADTKKVIGIAGVMGALNSEIHDDTTDVILEAAVFNRAAVRSASRKLGIHSEASSRFSKGVDPVATAAALDRAAQLLAMLDAGQVVSGRLDVCAMNLSERTLDVSVSAIQKRLGMDISSCIMCDILHKLHITCDVDTANEDTLHITIPSFRSDITCTADIAEEVLRIYGYDHIPLTPLSSAASSGMRSERQSDTLDLKRFLSGLAFHETLNFSFISPAMYQNTRVDASSSIPLINPLGEDTSLMRTTLIPSMLQNIATNLRRKNLSGKFFEIGRVYLADSLPLNTLPEEPERLCLGIFGKERDFFALKTDLDAVFAHLRLSDITYKPLKDSPTFHPGQCARVYAGETALGIIGRIAPDVADAWDVPDDLYIAQIAMPALWACAKRTGLQAKPLPKFPSVSRDLACVVDAAIPVGDMLSTIQKAGGAELIDAGVFDIYTGTQVPEGQKSVAFSLVFQSMEATLTDEQITQKMNRITRQLSENFQATIRQ